MDSNQFTPAQRFYSATETAKLVESPNGTIEPSVKTKTIKPEHVLYGVLGIVAILTIVAIFEDRNNNSLNRDKINV